MGLVQYKAAWYLDIGLFVKFLTAVDLSGPLYPVGGDDRVYDLNNAVLVVRDERIVFKLFRDATHHIKVLGGLSGACDHN